MYNVNLHSNIYKYSMHIINVCVCQLSKSISCQLLINTTQLGCVCLTFHILLITRMKLLFSKILITEVRNVLNRYCQVTHHFIF